MKYRKKTIAIEAFRWMHDEVPEWWRNRKDTKIEVQTGNVFIQTLEGTVFARPGDWILQGVLGEVYPCKHEIFEKTYEPAP